MPSRKPQNRDAGVPELGTGTPSSSPKGEKNDGIYNGTPIYVANLLCQLGMSEMDRTTKWTFVGWDEATVNHWDLPSPGWKQPEGDLGAKMEVRQLLCQEKKTLQSGDF